MPPRNASSRGSRAKGAPTPVARGSGGGASRGSRPGPGFSSAAHTSTITTVGVRRPNYGRAGRPFQLQVNSFKLTVEENDISHYDVVEPETLPARRKLALFEILQASEPNIFTPKMAYDGQKMAYTNRKLDLGQQNARKFPVSFPRANSASTRPPRIFSITLTLVATVSTEIIRRFIAGEMPATDEVTNVLMAYNIALRMKPNLNNPFRGRSFFIDQDRRPIGGGLEVWRGIFQSVRPTINGLTVNVDLAATIMYREGPLINLCNEFLGKSAGRAPTYLTPGDREFPRPVEMSRLKKFLEHVRIVVPTTGPTRPRLISGLSTRGANALQFTTHAGDVKSVADYFHEVTGQVLKFPTVICIEVGQGAMIPLEMCSVLKGQFVSRNVAIPQAQVASVLEFATKKPKEKLEAIKLGVERLQYQTSDYISQFGMKIDSEPLKVTGRVIDPPKLRYSGTGAQASLAPRNGAWNMVDKKFFQAATIKVWAVVIYTDSRRFGNNALAGMIKGFQDAARSVGIAIEKPQPVVKYVSNPQGVIDAHLREAGGDCVKQYGIPPNLIVVVLPENAGDIYTAVKHFGDVTMGVATQCLKAIKCGPGKPQYWANVMLKVNGKLGGINSIAESSAMSEIADPRNPAVIMGADVIHPPPGAQDRPSFTAVVGSVDSHASKYIASSRVQRANTEMIGDLKEMCKDVLLLRQDYQQRKEKKDVSASRPKKLIFFRDGVSESQYKQVIKDELPLIREACKELGLAPKITLLTVVKRHHNQMFPFPPGANDDKNAPAGTVIDTDITHPTDFDFFLQSHAGILGTSRPAHYQVLHDENDFNADSLQAISYALCHCYGPATRAVSLPAPVYYADRVCARAKNHFSPNQPLDASDTGTTTSGRDQRDIGTYIAAYKPLHPTQRFLMYFS